MSSLMQQNRNRILVAYKELLGLIRRLPLEKQKDVLTEARQRMRDHQYEANPVTQLDLFKRLCERIAFLRIITPRDGGPRSSIGAGTYVIRDGKLVRGTGEKMGTRVNDGKLSTSEAWERHNSLLRRQHFGKNPPKYDPSSF